MDIVDEALLNNEISQDDFEVLRSICTNSESFIQSLKEQQKGLEKTARGSINNILATKVHLEKLRIQEQTEINELRKIDEIRNDVQKQLQEVEEREIIARFELQEVKLSHDELNATLARVKKENLSRIDPFLERLTDEVTDLATKIQKSQSTYDDDIQIKIHLEKKIKDLGTQISMSIQAIKVQNDEILILEKDPKSLKVNHDILDKALNTLHLELSNIKKKIATIDDQQIKLNNRKLESESQYRSIQEKSIISKATLTKRETAILEINSELDLAKARNHDLLSRKSELDIVKKDVESQLRFLNTQAHNVESDYANSVQRLKKKKIILDQAKDVLPGLQEQILNSKMVLKQKQTELCAKIESVCHIKQNIDAFITEAYFKQNCEKDKKKDLEASQERVDVLEVELMTAILEHRQQQSAIASLTIARDKKEREKAKIESTLQEIQSINEMKDLTIINTTIRINEVSNRFKEYLALYDIVKNEKNQTDNLLQSSHQLYIEFREKVRMLDVEISALIGEMRAKDSAVEKEASAGAVEKSIRDHIQHDFNTRSMEVKSNQLIVQANILEIRNYNTSIQQMELEMKEMTELYNRLIAERNQAGIKLVNRNDEAIILQQKSNQLSSKLKSGEIKLLNLINELRLMRLQMDDLKAKYEILKRRLPLKSTYLTQIEELQKRIDAEKSKIVDCSSQLESPNKTHRWKTIQGNDPSLCDLDKKIDLLEKRINEKRHQILEKEIVLAEMTSINVKLRAHNEAKKDESFALSQSLQDIETKLNYVTRRMMATVSELSIYQATSLCLQQEKEEREELLIAAKEHFTRGEPPCSEAVKEWSRFERQLVKLAKTRTTGIDEYSYSMDSSQSFFMLNNLNESRASHQFDKNMDGIKTSAQPRPTAYIPSDILGVPVPYGQAAPFKPTVPGATMRHIRNPVPKPIEL